MPLEHSFSEFVMIIEMKTTLIFLGSLAVVLGIFAYFAVFGAPTGSYSVTAMGNVSSSPTSSNIFVLSSSTASGTMSGGLGMGSSTLAASSTNGGSPANNYGTSFATPALTWPEGNAKVLITGVSLEGNLMTFTLGVTMGPSPECVALNLRMVADEAGDLAPPNPASFAFPDSGNCNGGANETYTNQTTTFTVDPTALPLLFTTGGASNIYFEVTTSTDNGLQVDFPGTSG
jgi:hypothetical protein